MNLPPFFEALPQAAQKAAQQAFASAMSHLDVVPREAFEQQQALLAQAEARLSALEAQVQALLQAQKP